jgi:predicted GTPase
MSLKRSDKNTNGNGAAPSDAAGEPKYRDNAEINTKIDAYIQANPKEWTYIQGLPRERLERMIVLQQVNKLDRRARVRASVAAQLDANPELKEAYRKLVKNLPAEQQERAMMSIASRTLRTVNPRQQQQSKGARV